MSFRSLARKQRGFSLLEIMVAIGVAGILTYFISQMLVNSGKQATSIASKTDFNSFVNEMQGIFNNTGSCIAAFGGAGATEVPDALPATVSVKIGGTAYTVNSMFGGLKTDAASSTKKSLKIVKLEFTNKTSSSSAGQFVVPLSLVASREIAGEAASGGNTLSHTFNLCLTVDAAKKITSCAGQYTDYWSSTGASGMDIIYTGGNVAIGPCPDPTDPNCSPREKLDVVGKVLAKAYLMSSDARLKENVREIPHALDRVLNLHGVMFDWKNKTEPATQTSQLGFLAQEVEKSFPETVTTHQRDGMKAVAYGNLVAPLVEAFKEQQAIINRQQSEIEELKKAVARKR